MPTLIAVRCLHCQSDQIVKRDKTSRGTQRYLCQNKISTNTVLSELKKKEPSLESVNTALLSTLNPDKVTVDIERAGEAEMDEMWSFVGRKTNPRWLWHAIDHQTGEVLAYVFGRRKGAPPF